MLVKFSIENWMSFRDQTHFSMIASSERQHGERVPNLHKYRTRILPVAAIYGGNASGKTNLFKALNFVRGFVVFGNRPESLIPLHVFLLDSKVAKRPARFSLEILIDETIFEFSFTANKTTVLEEKLVEVASTRDKVLYHRRNGEIEFDKSLRDNEFLSFAFKGTRDNQLFLNNSISQKVDIFKPVYDWFEKYLVLVAPDTRFRPFERFLDTEHPLYSVMNDMLLRLDTGIARLDLKEIPLEEAQLPESLMSALRELPEGATMRIPTPNNDRIIVKREGEKFSAKQLIACHSQANGTEASFEIWRESDGTRRIIDLLPAFADLSRNDSTKVYVIDEVDRSLHTLLTRHMLEWYLNRCSPDSRAQLLFTTHDVLLMDQQLFRRDEMWVTERDDGGASTLVSFNDYKDIRYDKDVRRSYLQGRLGGIPRLLLHDTIKKPGSNQQNKGMV